MNWRAGFLFLWFGMGGTQAQESSFLTEANGQTIRIHVLHRFHRPATLTQDQFACWAGNMLLRHTQRTEHEACGMICKGEHEWGMMATTIHSHAWCPIVWRCPENTTPTRIGIHTHSHTSFFRVNEADLLMFSTIKKGLHTRLGQRVKVHESHHFSSDDFAGGPGYLMTHRGLYFQKGRHRIRKVSCGTMY